MTPHLLPFIAFFTAYVGGAPLVIVVGLGALILFLMRHRHRTVAVVFFFSAVAGHVVAYRDTLPSTEIHPVTYADHEIIRLENGKTYRHDGTLLPREGDEIRFSESAIRQVGKRRLLTSFEIVPPHNIRSRLAAFVREHSGSNLVLAFATGERLFTPSERNAFLKTGTMHLVAISAFHLGMLFLFLHALTRLLSLFSTIPPRTITYFSLLLKTLLLLWYLSLTGWTTPTVRAALFVLILDSLLSFGILLHPVQAFLWSLLFTSIVVPRSTLSWSFIMSALSVCAVISLWHRLPRSAFISLIALSTVINFLFIPIAAELTGWIPLIAPLANLLTVPTASVLLAFLMPMQMVFPLSPSLAQVFLVPADAVARVMSENLLYLSSLSDPTLLPLRQAETVWPVLFYVAAAIVFFGTGPARRIAMFVLLISAIPFFAPLGPSHGVEPMTTFPGEAYCVREGDGTGRIVEVHRYNFPSDYVQRKIALLPLSIERDLAACGVLRITGMHFQATLPRSLVNELRRRPRFSGSTVHYRESFQDSFSDPAFPLTFSSHFDTVH